MHWPTEIALRWHHNEGDGISNHQPHDYLLNRLLGRRSKKTSKLHITRLCVGNSLVTSEFPAQMASNAENASIWWCHHDTISPMLAPYQTDGHSPMWSWHQIRWPHIRWPHIRQYEADESCANFMLGRAQREVGTRFAGLIFVGLIFANMRLTNLVPTSCWVPTLLCHV